MSYKPLANTVNLSAANNVYNATAVLITNDSTGRTVTIANTAAPTDSGQHGNYPGGQVTIRVAPNAMTVIRKRPLDTVAAATGVYATKVAESGT